MKGEHTILERHMLFVSVAASEEIHYLLYIALQILDRNAIAEESVQFGVIVPCHSAPPFSSPESRITAIKMSNTLAYPLASSMVPHSHIPHGSAFNNRAKVAHDNNFPALTDTGTGVPVAFAEFLIWL